MTVFEPMSIQLRAPPPQVMSSMPYALVVVVSVMASSPEFRYAWLAFMRWTWAQRSRRGRSTCRAGNRGGAPLWQRSWRPLGRKGKDKRGVGGADPLPERETTRTTGGW